MRDVIRTGRWKWEAPTRRPAVSVQGVARRSLRRRPKLLPQLQLHAIRIHDPGETAIGLILPAKDFDTLRFKFCNQPVEVVDAKVDHERLVAGSEIVAVLFKR